jgi:hypothetical protein
LYFPVIDTNTKNVWAWTKYDEQGNVENVDLFQDNWKQLSEWSDAAVEALFAPPVVVAPVVLTDPIEDDEE